MIVSHKHKFIFLKTKKTAGTSIVQVTAGNYTRGGESVNIASGLGAATSLTRDDAAAIARLDDVRQVAAELRSRTWVEASPQARTFTAVLGTEPTIADIHGWTFLSGGTFAPADVSGAGHEVRYTACVDRDDQPARLCRATHAQAFVAGLVQGEADPGPEPSGIPRCP